MSTSYIPGGSSKCRWGPNVSQWSLTTLREKLVKIGAKVVSHSIYVVFQMAEVAVPRELFRAILERIQQLHGAPFGGAPSG